MMHDDIYYHEERKFASEHFFGSVIFTLLAFILANQTNGEIARDVFTGAFVLVGLMVFSALYYYFIAKFPDLLVNIRRYLIIFADLIAVTVLIIAYGSNGLFLFPFYVLIVMRSGLSFGISFFYASLILSVVSWLFLLYVSVYWREHADIIATFAITTFIIPFFYLRYIIRVHEENSELTQTLHEVVYDAIYDELTGVSNRKQYKEYVKKLIEEKRPFSLLFIDLDKFKVINDTYGHQIGDEVLKETTRRLSECLEEGDFIARLGGDEFVVLTERKKAYMEKFVRKLTTHTIGSYMVGDKTISIEISIGISCFPEDAKTEVSLAKKADEAMYFAKNTEGRDHCFYCEIAID